MHDVPSIEVAVVSSFHQPTNPTLQDRTMLHCSFIFIDATCTRVDDEHSSIFNMILCVIQLNQFTTTRTLTRATELAEHNIITRMEY